MTHRYSACDDPASSHHYTAAPSLVAPDHPLPRRFTGSSLIAYRAEDWDQVTVSTSAAVDHSALKEVATIEGRVSRDVSLSARGKSPLEVHRNDEQALNAAGFEKKFACDEDCADLYVA